MSRNFNKLDRAISYLRVGKIQKNFKPGMSVCDLGCGDGDLLVKLFEKYKSTRALGVDKGILQRKEGGGLEFVKVDNTAYDIEDKFDCILILAILKHIDPEKCKRLLTFANKILKTGGILLLATPTPASKPILEFLAFKLKLISAAEISDHKHYYSLKETEALLKGSGLEKITSGYFQFI